MAWLNNNNIRSGLRLACFLAVAGIAALFVGAGVISAADEKAVAKQVMDSVYGPYRPEIKGWLQDIGDCGEYRMRVVMTNRVETLGGERIYIVAAGDLQAEENAGHATPGYLRMFIMEKQGSAYKLVMQSDDLPFGDWGKAASDIQFQKLGSDYYYGWIVGSGSVNQGHVSMNKSILMPYGKRIVERSRISTCDAEFKLTVDMYVSGARVYPLRVKVLRDSEAGRESVQLYQLPFNLNKFRYQVPAALGESC